MTRRRRPADDMLQIRFLLLWLIVIASCNGSDKTPAPDNAAKTRTIAQPGTSHPPGDPSFVSPKDSISAQGPRCITRNVLQDKNGKIWLATWEGIICFYGKLFTNITLKNGLNHFHVFSILEDHSGNLWFGMIGGGVYRYDGNSFRLFSTKDGLVSDAVMCMLEDMSGNIWFGTRDGLSQYDGNSFTNFSTKDGLASNAISAIVQDKFGKIWIGTSSGVNCYDGQAFSPFNNEKGLSFYRVSSILEDKSGNIWIGSVDGLCCYNGKSQHNFPAITTSYIFEDKAGNLWLSGGKINLKSSDMTLTKYDGKAFTTVARDQQVFGIMEDKNGNIWYGTVHGACRYDGKAIRNF